jgi:competence protein ComEA
VPSIIDMDIATAEEIETLRGIGPALAKRIVADRDSLGPFGSIDELTRVKGIGKRLAAKIAPQVTFSLLPRHSGTENDGTSASPRSRRKSRRGESHI